MAQARSQVLVVDDDADCRDVLCQVLEDEGYRVEGAANGEDALLSLREGARPCLILLDLRMPVMDGVAFRQVQRRDPDLADIPVVIMTALGDPALEGERVLKKPIDLNALLATLREVCGSAR